MFSHIFRVVIKGGGGGETAVNWGPPVSRGHSDGLLSCIIAKRQHREKILVNQLRPKDLGFPGNSRNMSNLTLCLKSIRKMHDSKDKTIPFTL